MAHGCVGDWLWETRREKDVSAEPAREEAPSRFQEADVDSWRRTCAGSPPGEGTQAPLGLIEWANAISRRAERLMRCPCGQAAGHMKIETLKRSQDFRRVRGGVRWATPLFVIEGRRRSVDARSATVGEMADSQPPDVARFGFTITRKIGSAVIRNRIRRRLKEALRTLDAALIRSDHDYVVVASRAAHDYPFAGLQCALREAFDRLHQQRESGSGRGRRKAGRAAPASETVASASHRPSGPEGTLEPGCDPGPIGPGDSSAGPPSARPGRRRRR